MSEYADITIKNLSIWPFRNYLDGNIVSMFFSKKDLITTPNYKCNLEEDDFTKYEYKTTVQCAKERFDALGYTIKNFEKEFNDNKFQSIDYHEFLHNLGIDFDDQEKAAYERCKTKITFAKWKNAMRKIITYELENGNICWSQNLPANIIKTECEKVIFHSMTNTPSDYFYALNPEVIPLPYIFRLILECCGNDDEIVLDFSYLAFWDEDCIPKALNATGYIEKTIVLVEGSSDKDILEYAMRKIYPHLSDLFYFMDFDDNFGGSRDGGTSYIIKNLKTFYFSKLKANFIAIFDNDAEGYQSKCTLLSEIKNWPDNFRILLYPEINKFHRYPVLAPNGTIITDDINRKACSIELYLPDKLIKFNDKYCPIEFTARKTIHNENGSAESLYQGVISKKDTIKKDFHKLRKSIESGKTTFIYDEWHRMKQLLDTIVFAFAKNK